MEEMGWAYDEEDATQRQEKKMRRAVKNRLIKEATENRTIFDLDSIYKDGKLFGHQVKFLEGKNIFGGSIIRKYIIYNHEGKEYEVKYQFDFETRLIDFRIQEWCEKICDYVCIAQKIPFQLLCYGRVKIPANEIFDDIVGKMIMEINKKIEEYD